MAIQKITSGILADGAIVAADIANGSITTAKIADGNVTSAKIDTVANTKITGLVTSGQIANVANTQITGSIEATQVGTTVSQLFGMRNRIINGAMVIDQRYAGTATANTINGYVLDRWYVGQVGGSTGKIIAQQNAGSVTPPAGFSNYLGITSQSAYTVGASQQYSIQQPIEGFNTADLAWGTASAKTVTLSFWVRSSLTGTFAICLRNTAPNRSYVSTYTISAANTWEQKTITIAGDTSGTWNTSNSVGIYLDIDLGSGSSLSTTANTWTAGNYTTTSGVTNVVGTNGATFYITGIQLEVGSTATPFERRLIGTELALCQRYFQKSYALTTAVATATTTNAVTWEAAATSNYNNVYVCFPVDMRASPTVTIYSPNNGASGVMYASAANRTSYAYPAIRGTALVIQNISINQASTIQAHYTAEIEL